MVRKKLFILSTVLIVVVFFERQPSNVSAQSSWAPPIGIPNPGAWFLATSGSVQVTTGGTTRTFSGTGTASSPVIFQGSNMPRFTGTVTISGSYVIVDGVNVDGAQVIFSGNHLALRNSEVHNWKPSTNSTTVYVNNNATDIVIYKNQIHDNGDVASLVEHDVVGVGAGPGAQRIWILENNMYNHGGDSVLFGHNQKNSVKDIYIGKNVMHGDRENAIDIKEVSNVVISQNLIYTYRASSSSEGAGIVIHYCPINTNIIYNAITDAQVGISSASLLSDCPEIVTTRIIGNLISGIYGNAIQGWGTNKITQIVNNTLYNVDGAGVDIANAISGSLIENNIFDDITGSDISLTGSVTTQRNNIADTVDPLFVASNNLHLQSSSPAKDAGVSSSVYSAYQNAFGIGIAVDFEGIARPQGAAWDIGAYEYVSGTTPTPTPTPTPVVGDINSDHIVNSIDYSLMNADWFTTNSRSDLNRDGIVNAIDYSLLNANWFKTW